MLTRTFLHISGVGAKRELSIWRAGIESWSDFLARGEDLLPPGLYRLGRRTAAASLEALERPDGLADLAAMIPPAEHWRFYPHYKKAVYLDIESGGDPQEWGGITVVGLYDGRRTTQYTADRNLAEVNHCLRGYEIVVTFGGKSFDLPMLRKAFPGIYIPPVHIDLRWALARLGYRGGLKRIERRLNLTRPPSVRDLSGWDAVRLWREHLEGRRQALPLLLEYNAYDAVNLAPLLELSVRELRRGLLARAG